MSVRCDGFATDFPSFSFAEGHGADVLPATSTLRKLFTATILVWFPSFLDLLVSSIATCPRNMKIYIEKWGEWSEKKKKEKGGRNIFPPRPTPLNNEPSLHAENTNQIRSISVDELTARERGSHGFCAQNWTGHPLVSFLPQYRVGIPQLAHNFGWWQWPGKWYGG